MAEKKENKELAGKHILMVIAPKDFRDEELLEPKRIFVEVGATVSVASIELVEAQGMLGARIKPDILLKDVKVEDYCAVVVVGGMGSPTYLWNDQTLHKLLQSFNSHKKVVAGICLSGAALAKAGVLRNCRATVWATAESLAALKEGQAEYVKQHIVQDGHIITADGPEAASGFGLTIVNSLSHITSVV